MRQNITTTYIHFSSLKNIDSSVVKRSGQVDVDVMWSVTAVAVSAYRFVPGLDVCPPIQEDLGCAEVAFPSSTVEDSPSILSEAQRDNTKHSYME